MTRWAESKSASRIYLHYFNEVIEQGRLVIQADRADSLAHVLRYVLKGCAKRNEMPYAALEGNLVFKVKDNCVIIERRHGAPAVDPISEKEYRVLAPVTFKDVLGALGSMLDNKLDRVAFLNVTDFSEVNKATLEAMCKEKGYTYSFTGNKCVIIK